MDLNQELAELDLAILGLDMRRNRHGLLVIYYCTGVLYCVVLEIRSEHLRNKLRTKGPPTNVEQS